MTPTCSLGFRGVGLPGSETPSWGTENQRRTKAENKGGRSELHLPPAHGWAGRDPGSYSTLCTKAFSLYTCLISSWGRGSQNNTDELLFSRIRRVWIFFFMRIFSAERMQRNVVNHALLGVGEWTGPTLGRCTNTEHWIFGCSTFWFRYSAYKNISEGIIPNIRHSLYWKIRAY